MIKSNNFPASSRRVCAYSEMSLRVDRDVRVSGVTSASIVASGLIRVMRVFIIIGTVLKG